MNLVSNLKAKKIILFLFILMSIFNCGSVYHSKITDFLWEILLFVIFIISLHRMLNKLVDKYFIFCIIFTLYILIFLFMNYMQSPFGMIHYLVLLLINPLMIIAYFLDKNNKSYKHLFYMFEKIVIILSIISLVFWILASIGLNPNMTKITYWGDAHAVPGYFGVDFLSQSKVSYLGLSNIIRNTGIFSEAPMYSYVLCIALFIELFLKRKSSIFDFNTICLVITIISTTSTTGLLISFLAIFIKVFLLIHNNVLKICLLLLIPVVFLILQFILYNKIGNSAAQMDPTSSYAQRYNDIVSCYKAWTHHLILGNGLDNNTALSNYGNELFLNGSFQEVTGGTTGLFSVLAHGGLLYAILYIFPTLLISLKKLKYFVFALLTFILFIFTAVSNSYIYMMILSYFWAYFIRTYFNSKRNEV